LVSDNEDAVKTYSTYNTSVITSATSIVVDGKTYYYSGTIYGWDGNNVNDTNQCYVRKVNRSFSSNE
jgi:hypothetical protein